MKLGCKAYFTEYAALLLQRTVEEGHPDLVLEWGQSIFEFLSRYSFNKDFWKKIIFIFIIIISFHAEIIGVVKMSIDVFQHFVIDLLRRDEEMSTKCLEGNDHIKRTPRAPKGNEPTQVKKYRFTHIQIHVHTDRHFLNMCSM